MNFKGYYSDRLLGGITANNNRDFMGPGGQDYIELGHEPWWYTLGYILPQDYSNYLDQNGNLPITVNFEVNVEDDVWLVTNQDIAPIEIVSSTPASDPDWSNWYAGDTHYHTDLTNSMDWDSFNGSGELATWLLYYASQGFFWYELGEYGAPLAITSAIAPSVGLDWITVTDHSYEIDGSNDWASSGPEADAWRDLLEPNSYQFASNYAYGWDNLENSPAFSEFLFLKGVEFSIAAPDPHEPPKVPETLFIDTAQLHMLTYGFDNSDLVISEPG